MNDPDQEAQARTRASVIDHYTQENRHLKTQIEDLRGALQHMVEVYEPIARMGAGRVAWERGHRALKALAL